METKQSVASSAATLPATRSGKIDVQDALMILKDFITECRKELRKLEKVQTSITEGDEIYSLHFNATGFDLKFIVKEGGLA